ncbi:MAG: FkbM family methyltransferase [Pseudanabaena sp.]|jgi:FkbM family methyltransferase
MKSSSSFLKNTLKYYLNKFKSFFIREAYYLGDYQLLTRLFTEQLFFVDTRDISVAPSIIVSGKWEPTMTKVFMETVKDGMTVIDIGGHLGYYTILSGSLVGIKGNVYTFEANPIIFETLFKNVFINGFIEKIKIENKAVYSCSTKIKFNTLKRATGGNSIVHFSDSYKETYQESVETIEIDAISLDDYFGEASQNIDVMKIDAEGSEPYIFRGMEKLLARTKKITIFCEFNLGLIVGAGNDPKEFLESLIRYRFIIKRIDAKQGLVNTSIDELLDLKVADLFLLKNT